MRHRSFRPALESLDLRIAPSDGMGGDAPTSPPTGDYQATQNQQSCSVVNYDNGDQGSGDNYEPPLFDYYNVPPVPTGGSNYEPPLFDYYVAQ